MSDLVHKILLFTVAVLSPPPAYSGQFPLLMTHPSGNPGRIFFLLAFTFLFLLAGCTKPPPKPEAFIPGDYSYLKDYMRWYINKQIRKNDVPGLSIALVDRDGVLWADGFGYADRERKIPATAETAYQVGSISKLFTATAAMQFVEKSLLDLNRPIKHYLPEFSIRSRWGKTPPLRILPLLTHHAGLPTYHLKGFFSKAPLVTLVHDLKDEYLAYPPESVFNYSNLGPDLVGAAMERVSGKQFAKVMEEVLLQPLGMRNSSFTLSSEIKKHLAQGYIDDTPTAIVTLRDEPAGGLFSTVNDMSRFLRFVLNHGTLDGRKILQKKTLARMLSPHYQELPLNLNQKFGIGWFLSGIRINGAKKVAWHNGGTNTFLSQLIVLPENNLGVVVLGNSDTARSVVYEVAEEVLRLAMEMRDGIHETPSATEETLYYPDAQTLEAYTGYYSLMGTLAKIERKGDRLKFHILDHKLDLVPESANRFHAEYSILGLFSVRIPFPPVEFKKIEGRDLILMHDRGVIITGEKIRPYTIPAAWRDRVGHYRVINPDETYLVDVEKVRLMIEDEMLLMNVKLIGLENREVKVVLVPISDTAVYVFGLGRNVGDVSYVFYENGEELTRFSGFYFKKASVE